MTVDKTQNKAIDTEANVDFEALFRQYWPRIYALIYRMVGDPTESEDLALEVFLKLYQKPPRKWQNIGAWLYRVATNLSLNALRAGDRREQYEQEAGKIFLEVAPPPTPAQSVEKAEERQRVRDVLKRMRPRSAKILILRYSGFSYAEIAAVVEVSPKSVGTLLNRAERDFEKRYRPQE